MENIKLINQCTATLQLSPVERDKKTFLFWTEFFMESIESQHIEITSSRFPVLIQELNKMLTPSYLNVNADDVRKKEGGGEDMEGLFNWKKLNKTPPRNVRSFCTTCWRTAKGRR